jgi:guanylate kinase
LSNSTDPACLFVIAAPSGGGKTSLVNALLEQDSRLALSISHTTRGPRPGEENGRHYHFVSSPEFESMAKDGEFMEYARVFDHHYGSNRSSVAKQLWQGLDVILEIDWQGARQVRAVFPDCCCIFIIPPSLDVLRARLTGRGQDSAAVIQRRMRDAQAEISHWDEFDQLVVNNNFELALEELRSIINDHRKQRPHKVNKDYQRLAQQLGKS